MKCRVPIPITRMLFAFLTLFSAVDTFAQETCASATPITSGITCTNTTGQTLRNRAASSPNVTTGACGGTAGVDIWYSFTAQSQFPQINLSAIGANLSGSGSGGTKLQLLTGACTALTSLNCTSGTGTTLSLSPSAALTLGQTYYIRVFATPTTATSGTNANWGFSICVVDPPPVNDACANSVLLTSSTTCNPTEGTVVNATTTGAPNSGTCGGTVSYDVWYRFVAQSATPTISLTNVEAGFNTPKIQILSGACPTPTILGCVTGTTYTGTGLTIGNTYFVRLFSTAGTAPTTTGGFDICIIDPPVNDNCAGSVLLTSGASCTPTAGTVEGATMVGTDPGSGTCGGTVVYDVWYRFVAQSTNPSISLTGVGANFNTPKIQLLTGTCGALSIQGCVTGTTYNTTGLTIGNTYYIRLFSTTGAIPGTNADFNICVVDPPANDLCANAVTITSNEAYCNGTAGTVVNATTSVGDPGSGTCGGTVLYDVWYRFVAQTTNPLINLTGVGANFNTPKIQLLTGTCSGLTIQGCFTGTSYATTGLTIGTTYFIRLFSTTGTVPTSNAAFTICVVDLPDNDNCAGAINLTVNTACSKTFGATNYATNSGLTVPAPCTGSAGPDVWYRFTATSANTTVTLSDFGANFGGTRRFQLFSGTCGVLVPVVCVQGTGGTVSLASTTLIPGTTYFIRIYSGTVAAPTVGGDFSICVFNTPGAQRYGNSYVNLSKKQSGGVVQKGDTLEIRMTINHTSGTAYYMRYYDSIPSNTVMLSGTTDSIRVITNEGITFRRYTATPNTNDDAATYVPNPLVGQYQIRMNLGFGTKPPGAPASNSTLDMTGAVGEMIAGSDRPRGGGGMLFATSFRVRVTGNPGDTITLRSGKFIYRTSAGGSDITFTTTPYQIVIDTPQTLCANSIGVNNAEEFGGTFGSGTALNRSTDLNFPIPNYTFVTQGRQQAVGDGTYAIVKNLSPRNGTNRNARRAGNCTGVMPSNDSCVNRMFDGYWFIDGDHSGTNNSIGNAPPGDGVNSGYMLTVNADYVASEVYRQNITNLCPNTYYEFSAWVRNICPACGIDSAGTSSGKPGVYPNLSFSMNGLDKYSTGEIDTLGWIKKGFVFKTGVSQTSATFAIRNNSQGGGGNDWAIDDIAIATCLPNMDYSPTLNPIVCQGNSFEIRDTIRSFFKNYTHHQWQRSTNGGGTWTDLGVARDSVPVFNPSKNAWEYITKYTIPPAFSTPANNGDLYRVLVATTSTNLANPDCRVTDGISFISLTVQDCGPVLSTDLLSFSGKLVNDHGVLNWTTSKEDEPVEFMIDRSEDGINYHTIGNVKGYNNNASLMNSYSFTDPTALGGNWKYRIVMSSKNSGKKYSRVIQLNKDVKGFGLVTIVNPFVDKLDFEITLAEESRIETELLDMNGRIVKKQTFNASAGSNSLSLSHTESLSNGMYIIQIRNNDKVIARKVLKKSSL